MIPSHPARVTRGEALNAIVAQIGRDMGYQTTCGHEFTFPELARARGVSRYKPDCVWFAGEQCDQNAIAIIEIDDGPSRKHRVGGVALANIVALRSGRQSRHRRSNSTDAISATSGSSTRWLFQRSIRRRS